MKSTALPSLPKKPLAITDATHVGLHPLRERQDHDAWVIGRAATGDFVSVPPVARRAIMLLSGGMSIGEASIALRSETGSSVALADFVNSLDELGFIASVDGQPRGGQAPPEPSLPWLQPKHVRWLLHPAVPWVVLAAVTAAAAVTFINPAIAPRYHDLVWDRHSGIVLAVNVALGWVIMGLHELGHVATARALGAPARMSLGTRLQFLAVQTDVSGVWAASRRQRITVYLSGMTVNLAVASICIIIRAEAFAQGVTGTALALIAIVSLLFLPMQFLVFMRTDVYFVIQDFAGCINLYADGSAHLRFLARRLGYALLHKGELPIDPTETLQPRERRAIRVYSFLLLAGTAITIGTAVFISIPATVTLLARAFRELPSNALLSKVDGLAALAAIGIFYCLWLRAWFRRHGRRLALLKIPLPLRFSRR